MTWRHSTKGATSLAHQPYQALVKLADGEADAVSMGRLQLRINWTRISYREFFDPAPDVTASLNEAVAALNSISMRQREGKGLTVTKEEFDAIGLGLNIADDVEKNTTRKQSLETLLIAEKQLKEMNKEYEDYKRRSDNVSA